MTTAVKNWFEFELKTGCWIVKVGNFVGCNVVVMDDKLKVAEACTEDLVPVNDSGFIGEAVMKEMRYNVNSVKIVNCIVEIVRNVW